MDPRLQNSTPESLLPETEDSPNNDFSTSAVSGSKTDISDQVLNPSCSSAPQHVTPTSATGVVSVHSAQKPLVSSSSASTLPNDYIYNVKWIDFRGNFRPIITQNENGPCPIIAIANVLSLRGILNLSEGTELLTGQRLVSLLSDILLSQPSSCLDSDQLLNYETTVSDAFSLFPSLQTGLDINVRFNGVGAFEFTPALGVFDLFKIPLYHGWLVDPDEIELATVVGDRTYNQLTERIIQLKASPDPEEMAQGLLAEDFLGRTASQLTYHGLCELVTTVADGQLAILFRNNHYNTLFKKEGQIYVLVTDMGLLNEPTIVWEVLDDVDGDTQFVDAAFNLYVPSSPSPALSTSSPVVEASSRKAAINRDPFYFPVEAGVIGPSAVVSVSALERACAEHLKSPSSSSAGTETDLDLAARLQLAEIESSRLTESGKCDTILPNKPNADFAKCQLSADKLSHVCSDQLLAQAQVELGSGSDLDLAVQLQWAELNQSGLDDSRITVTPEHTSVSVSTARTGPKPAGPIHSRRISSNDNDRSTCTLL